MDFLTRKNNPFKKKNNIPYHKHFNFSTYCTSLSKQADCCTQSEYNWDKILCHNIVRWTFAILLMHPLKSVAGNLKLQSKVCNLECSQWVVICLCYHGGSADVTHPPLHSALWVKVAWKVCWLTNLANGCGGTLGHTQYLSGMLLNFTIFNPTML